MDVIWLTLEKTNIWMILRHSGKYQAKKENKYQDNLRRSIHGL
jgi:hypothetical protein